MTHPPAGPSSPPPPPGPKVASHMPKPPPPPPPPNPPLPPRVLPPAPSHAGHLPPARRDPGSQVPSSAGVATTGGPGPFSLPQRKALPRFDPAELPAELCGMPAAELLVKVAGALRAQSGRET